MDKSSQHCDFPTSPSVLDRYLLIVASSGRMLAQGAVNSGLCPLVIDLYGDQDTRAISEAVCRIDVLDERSLKAALDEILSRYPVKRTVYGSGLEGAPGCIEMLERSFELIGNDYATFTKVQAKRSFFARLARLEIPYPEVVYRKPLTAEGWLLKPFQGEGGLGIQRFIGQPVIESTHYWQRLIEGQSGSALFLADGCKTRIIGFNTQWCAGNDPDREFLFAGIINHSPLSHGQEQRVEDWIRALVEMYGLKGLNTLDFIVQDDKVFVLEVNPRPSASLQLYDGNLLSMHIDSCYGRLSKCFEKDKLSCGYQIVYANASFRISEHFQWPEGCADLPAAGLIIRKGQPICSIIARDKSRERVYAKLMATQQIIVNQIQEGL